MARRFVKYNPAFLSDSQIIDTFVVRHADLELIMRIIEENMTGSNQHVLIIGQRGSGKTTLARRITAEIAQQEELRNRWYPLTFSEESYKAVTAADFWLEALFHLANQTGDEKWLRTHDELRLETDDQRLGERALWQLLDFADKQAKRILLVVENLNMLFGDLTSKDEAWKIRHTLMNEPRMMLLATATSKFDDIESPSHAMFEMFKMHELKPLDDDECNHIWELVTGKKLTGEQIKPVRILTGGNPRLLAIIAKFGAHRSFRQLLDDLVDLIDDHTDYFKSHLDNMPSIERKVYLALAELWKPSTAREIAATARLDINKTSSLLNRLVHRGVVVIEEAKKRTKWYRIAEGIYNIYYLMRRRGSPADRVKAVVSFMVAMYGPESATSLIAEEACKLSPDACTDHYAAYEEVIKNVPDREILEKIINSTPKNFFESSYINETLKKFTKVNINAVLTEDLSNKEKAALKIAREINNSGIKFGKAGNIEKALTLFNTVIDKFKDSDKVDLIVEAACAMFNKGFSFDILKQFDEAIRIYDEIIALYKSREEKQIAELVASAFRNKGITLGMINRYEEAISVYDELIAIYKDRLEIPIAQQVAMAMINKGIMLNKSNRHEEEIKIYEQLILLYKDRQEVEIAENVAIAMTNKGCRLNELNRHEGAIELYKTLIATYKDRKELAIIIQVAKAMISEGYSLNMLNRHEQALRVYENIIASYKDRQEVEIAKQVIGAMRNIGISLGRLNRFEDAVNVYNEMITLYKDRQEIQIVEPVSNTMINMGVILGDLNRTEEEMKIYNELIALYKDRQETQIIQKVAGAMRNKGVILGSLNRSEEAIDVYDEIIALYKDRQEEQVAEQVACAMRNKALRFAALNNLEEAVQCLDEMIAFYKDREESLVVNEVAKAMINKGVILGKLNRPLEEIQVYDELIAAYKFRKEVQISEEIANALVNKGSCLAGIDKNDEAEDAYNQAIKINPNLLAAYVNLIALFLKKPERHEEALQTAEVLFNKNPNDGELLNNVSWAFYKCRDLQLFQKAEMLAKQAVAVMPDDLNAQHTLACISAALGNGDDALEWTKKYVKDAALVEKSIEDAIELFVELAAAGYAKEALEILVDSPAEIHLEPLVAGLKLYAGETVQTAVEIREIANDLVKRIEQRRQKHE